jgi:hypothetical protein
MEHLGGRGGPPHQNKLRVKVRTALSSSESAEIIIQTSNVVVPTGVRIQNALLEGGVSGPIGRDMVHGFYVVVQLKAVQERKPIVPNEAWYCQIYPFSHFCH